MFNRYSKIAVRAYALFTCCFAIACTSHLLAPPSFPGNSEKISSEINDNACKSDPFSTECWCNAPKLSATERRTGIDIKGPLSELSEDFRAVHAAARRKMCSELKTDRVIVRYSFGNVEITWNNRKLLKSTSIYTPYAHILKAVAHAVFLVSLLADEAKGSQRDEQLVKVISDVDGALSVFLENQPPVRDLLSAATRERQITILTATRRFLIELHTGQTSANRQTYLEMLRSLIIENLNDASRSALSKLHTMVQSVKHEVERENPNAWKTLMVVANVGHQARARELGIQYFERIVDELMTEGARTENRLVVLENVTKAAEQRGFLSAHIVDRQHSVLIFGNPSRLQWDILAENGNMLDELFPAR